MIQARVPALCELIDRRAEVVPVLGGMGAIGGIVCSRVSVLLFVDSAAHTVYRYPIPYFEAAPNKGTLEVHRPNATGAFGLTIDHQGRLLTSYRSPGRVTRVDIDGVERDIAEGIGTPSDLVYAIDGSIYVADLPESGAAGAVFQITRRGETRIATSVCRRPSGVTLDPRQLHVLVADQHDNAVYRFPCAADGALGSPSVALDGPALSGAIPGPLRTDETGNLYVITPGGLRIYRPDGIHLGTVVLPEEPVNLCWGRGFSGLYLTTRSSIFFIATKSDGTPTF